MDSVEVGKMVFERGGVIFDRWSVRSSRGSRIPVSRGFLVVRCTVVEILMFGRARCATVVVVAVIAEQIARG
jgi:hypothetical protein